MNVDNRGTNSLEEVVAGLTARSEAHRNVLMRASRVAKCSNSRDA